MRTQPSSPRLASRASLADQKIFLALLTAIVFMIPFWPGLSPLLRASAQNPRNLEHSLRFIQPVDKPTPSKAETLETFGQLPLAFEANQGQTDKNVRFISRGSGYGVFLTPTELVLKLRPPAKQITKREDREVNTPASRSTKSTVLRFKFVGANPAPQIDGLEELPGKVNYFIGNDSTKWHTKVRTYAKVKYRAVYPGVDLVYYGNQRQLEYDLIVAPGSDPRKIVMRVEGNKSLALDRQGNLTLKMPSGTVMLHKPNIYQNINGTRQAVEGRYKLNGAHQVGFHVGDYDTSKPLIIDPVVLYSTYIAGFAVVFEESYGIAVDGAGNAYITGVTGSTNLPSTAGAYDTSLSGPTDAFVIKIDAAGSAPVYSTYLGGSGFDQGHGIAVDSAGNAYITGITGGNFPILSAYQNTYGGSADAFVTKLGIAGDQLLYSTYLGGSDDDRAVAIAVNSAFQACVTGQTLSNNFKVTAGAVQPTLTAPGFGSSDIFVTKLDMTGNAIYSTYFGGNYYEWGRAVAMDGPGNVYVTGETASLDYPTTAGAFDTTFNAGNSDSFVTKFNLGGLPVYSTFLGGSDTDQGDGITVDLAGNAYVAGITNSTDFPVTANASQPAAGGGFDAFVTKLNPSGTSPLLYSTYLGGSSLDWAKAIAVDSAGNAYIAGRTSSNNFPTLNPIQGTSNSGVFNDGFVTYIDSTSTRLFSTYLGGSGHDWCNGIAVDGLANVYVTGFTGSSLDFPILDALQPNYGGGFVTKYGPNPCADPPNTTMVAWYPFDETTGTTAANLATGNFGTRFGGPVVIPGKVGNALRFDANDDYVESPSTIVTNIGPAGLPANCSGSYSTCRGDFSIDAWVRMPSGSSNLIMPVVEKLDSSGPTPIGYGFWIFNGYLLLQLADAAAGTGSTTYNSTPIPIPNLYNNQWHHVAVTVSRRATPAGISWYLDGVLISTSNPTIPPTRYGSLANNAPLRIGSAPPSTLPGCLRFKGDMDELEIFNRVLTQPEVKAIFAAGASGKCKS
jgi:hypothetical protein